MVNRMVLTTNGVKRMNDIMLGDCVYTYYESKPVPVIDIDEMTINEFIEIHTPDGRHQMMTIDEFAVLCGYKNIVFNMAKFNEGQVVLNKRPSPYTAGFLMFAGNLKDEYISVHKECIKQMDSIFHQYRLTPGKTFMNQTYLDYEVDHTGLKWKNFFSGHTFDLNSRFNIIPYTYQYGNINERTQFIQGVSDASYAMLQSTKARGIIDNGMTINHSSQVLIEGIQRMLWSLNVPTLIEYDDELKYILCFNPGKTNLASFFYNEDYIQTMLELNRKHNNNVSFYNSDDVTYEMARCIKLKEPVKVLIPKLPEVGLLYWDVDYMPAASC